MPAEIKQWFDTLDSEDVLEPVNPERFKKATASIICSIINFGDVQDSDELCKFCDLFQEEFHIDEENAKKLFKDSAYLDKNLKENAQIIKEELKNDEYKLMEFMKVLNRFIIIDECKDEDYCIFTELKTHLFS